MQWRQPDSKGIRDYFTTLEGTACDKRSGLHLHCSTVAGNHTGCRAHTTWPMQPRTQLPVGATLNRTLLWVATLWRTQHASSWKCSDSPVTQNSELAERFLFLNSSFTLKRFAFMCLSACIRVCIVHSGARRGHQISLKWSYRCLWATGALKKPSCLCLGEDFVSVRTSLVYRTLQSFRPKERQSTCVNTHLKYSQATSTACDISCSWVEKGFGLKDIPYQCRTISITNALSIQIQFYSNL